MAISVDQDDINVTIIVSNKPSITVTEKGPKGDDGADGAIGQGFVDGGSENQFIQKNSATDYDTKWSAYTLPAADGAEGTVLTTDGAGTVSFAHPQTISENVKNVSGGPLLKGTPVHVTGSVGNLAEVIAADAATNYPAHFVLNEDLDDDAEGLGIALGFINNVNVPDASIYTEGQTVYLGAAGGWVTSKPTGTNAIQNLGVIIKVNTSGNKISGIVMGAGRANDIPNIPQGNIWAGNSSSVATATDTAYIDIANSRVGIGNTSPSEKLHVTGKANIHDGSNNVLISTGNSTITASNTTAVGYQALTALTTGVGNTAIGYQSGNALTSGGANTLVGYESGNQISGGTNTIVGYQAGQSPQGSGSFFGFRAGQFAGGFSNTAIGYEAAKGVSGSSTFSSTVAIGYQALTALTTGTGNTALGYQAGNTVTTGINNTILGYSAGGTNHSYTTLVGYDASADGNYGVAIGWLTRAGAFSTSVGTLAGGNSSTATYNVFIGDSAGRFNNGDRNVIIGRRAGYSSGTSSDSVFIGYQAGYNETGNNKLYIANSDTTTPLIYGEFDNNLVRVNGDFEATGGYGFNGESATAVQTGYTPTNVTTTRSFDADSTTLDGLADVVGTLIEDLKTKGLISA